MKNALLGLLLASSALYCAETPHMELLISDMMEMDDVKQCDLKSVYYHLMNANARVKISENDVTAWNPKTGRWALDPARYTQDMAFKRLQNHCFYLEIDGKLVTSGPVLSSHSARLSRLPTLKVFITKNSVDLQLNSGNTTHDKLIYTDELNSLFRRDK